MLFYFIKKILSTKFVFKCRLLLFNNCDSWFILIVLFVEHITGLCEILPFLIFILLYFYIHLTKQTICPFINDLCLFSDSAFLSCFSRSALKPTTRQLFQIYFKNSLYTNEFRKGIFY